MKKGQKRDVTEILSVLKLSDVVVNAAGTIVARVVPTHLFEVACRTLRDMDARTGRRDPSKRKNAKRAKARVRR